MLKYDYLHRILRKIFFQLGGVVATYPYYFVFSSIVVFLILIAGFSRLSVINNAEYLYVPTNSRALKEREVIESLFPPDNERIDLLRLTKIGPSASVIIEAKDGGSILNEGMFKSVKHVDEIIQNITVLWEQEIFKYEDLCLLESDSECFNNEIIKLHWEENLKKEKNCIRYPIHINEGASFGTLYVIWLGGVTVDSNSCIQDAKAIRLMYFLSEATPTKKQISSKWEKAFLQKMSETHLQNVYIYESISTMLDSEASRFTEMVIKIGYAALPVMLGFAILSCFTSDWVTSKPWIGVAAYLAPLMGAFAAFGLLLFLGMEYPELNIAIPLLMLAIGLDDSFVVLSSWRRTSRKNNVIQRMRETFSDAAVSITITSLTNFLSFVIGITSPYRVHRMFFIYASVSVIMAYVYEITFFGGILALSGYREEKNLHALFFTPVKEHRKTGKSVASLEDGHFLKNSSSMKEKQLVTFYRDKLGIALSNFWGKMAVLFTFFVYLSGGLYGLTFIRQGLDVSDIFPSSSYALNYTLKTYELFSRHLHVIQIVINETLDYSNPIIQRDMEEILMKFGNAPKMAGSEVAESWLRSYLMSKENSNLWISYRGYNLSETNDFVEVLHSIFLNFPVLQRYNKDVVFNDEKTQILASRYMILSKDVSDGYQESDLIETLWSIADSCKYPVYVHNARFVIQSLSIGVKDICIRTIITATVLAMLIFVITVPHLLSIFLVGFTIVTIETCVVGYSCLWGVGLDIISSTGLIVTTGLSVDYLAHISFAYVVAEKKNPDEKMRVALHAAGHPVFQGCFSTILMVTCFWVGSAYAFIILFKILFLLMLFAGFNALMVLPVCLSSCESIWLRTKRKKEANFLPEINNLICNPKSGKGDNR